MQVKVVGLNKRREIMARITLDSGEWESLVRNLKVLQETLTARAGRPIGQMFGELADQIESEFDQYDDTKLFARQRQA